MLKADDISLLWIPPLEKFRCARRSREDHSIGPQCDWREVNKVRSCVRLKMIRTIRIPRDYGLPISQPAQIGRASCRERV